MRSLINWFFWLVELSPEQQKKLMEERGRREVLLAMVELRRLGVQFPNLLHLHGCLKELGRYTRMPTIVERCDQLVSLGFIKKLGQGGNEVFAFSDTELKRLRLPNH